MATEPLGNNTSNVSPQERRTHRMRLKEHAGELLPDARVAWCMHKIQHDKNNVILCGSESQHKAHLRNVAMCGSVWTCPVCSSRITEQRREELKSALKSAYLPVMVTLTLQHDRDETLLELVTALRDAFRKLKSGKAWMLAREKYSIKAYVTALEITFGLENGWHPHLHMLMWLDMDKEQFKHDELKSELSRRYRALLAKSGKYASDEYGIDVRSGNADAGDYVSKWSLELEMTKSPVKLGRGEHLSPFQLLELSRNGNAYAGELFKQYAHVMTGRKQLTWSQHARDILSIGEEKTDEQLALELELAPEPDDTKELMSFTKSTWSKIVRLRLVPDLLRVADSCNVEAIYGFLELHGIERIEILGARDENAETSAGET